MSKICHHRFEIRSPRFRRRGLAVDASVVGVGVGLGVGVGVGVGGGAGTAALGAAGAERGLDGLVGRRRRGHRGHRGHRRPQSVLLVHGRRSAQPPLRESGEPAPRPSVRHQLRTGRPQGTARQ